MSIYDSIVNGINQTKTSPLGIAAYLQSLKPTVKLLRRSYLNRPVHVPYHEEDVQAAYLISEEELLGLIARIDFEVELPGLGNNNLGVDHITRFGTQGLRGFYTASKK